MRLPCTFNYLSLIVTDQLLTGLNLFLPMQIIQFIVLCVHALAAHSSTAIMIYSCNYSILLYFA